MFSRASITMSNATKFCWGLGSFSKMVEGASKALRANSLTWSKISNGLMNNEVYPVNILNIQQRKNKPKRLELFSQMSKKCLQLHTFFFYQQNKCFRRLQGKPVNFLLHNNNDKQVWHQENVYMFNQTFGGKVTCLGGKTNEW